MIVENPFPFAVLAFAVDAETGMAYTVHRLGPGGRVKLTPGTMGDKEEAKIIYEAVEEGDRVRLAVLLAREKVEREKRAKRKWWQVWRTDPKQEER